MKISKGGVVSKLLADVVIPKMFKAKQTFPRPCINPSDIPSAVAAEMSKERVAHLIKPGMNIAITAGSRGIANVDIITKAIVDFVKAKGAKPFIVAAMGSHGGATDEGQKEMLAGFKITEETMGCPIKSNMTTVVLGQSEFGKTVYMDKNAYEADGVIVSCRIKPHNAFRGPIESGFCKMMVVGLGKQEGAESVHSDGMGVIAKNLPANAKVMLEKGPIIMGVGTIENAYDETARIVAVHRDDIVDQEPDLLKEAFSNMPKLLMNETDVLVVDEIGKNYSGTGVDPNITGTFSTEFAHGGVKVQRTCYLNLSPISHGNALGVGLASAITMKIFDEMDAAAMYPNIITNTVIKSGMIAPVMGTDKEAIQFCIRTLNGVADKTKARVVRIHNSLHIGDIMMSEAFYDDVVAGKWEGLTAASKPETIEFDSEGNITTKF